MKKGTVPLIVASGFFGFFNAVALALFLWAGTIDPKSNDSIGWTSVSIVLAWLGDLVALALAFAGAVSGRKSAAAILWGVAVIVLALGSAGVAVLAWLARAIVDMPVPIH